MAAALIQFTQGPNTDVPGRAVKGTITDGIVTVSNGDDVNVANWNFELVYVPPGSAVPLSSQSSAVATFDFPQPDVPGSYRVQLTTTDNLGNIDIDVRNLIVPFPNADFLVAPYQGLPALRPLEGPGAKPNEMNVGGQAFGWDGTDDINNRLMYQVVQSVDSLVGGVGAVTSVVSGSTNILAVSPTTNNVVVSAINQEIDAEDDNTFYGIDAGNVGVHSGGDNTGFGVGALASLTTGSENTGVGEFALNSVTTGSSNTAVGAEAGSANVSGIASTYVGTTAGELHTGSSSDFFGSGVAPLATTGAGIAVFGQGGLPNLTTGANITAIGGGAVGAGLTTEDGGTFVGNSAGHDGASAGYLNVHNVIFGLATGQIHIGTTATPTPSGGVSLRLTDTDKAFLTNVVASTAAIATPEEGMTIYSTADVSMMFRQGAAWVPLGTGGGTVTNVSVAAASATLLSVATPTTTPVLTVLNQIIDTTANSTYYGAGTGVNALVGATSNSAFGSGALPLLTTGDDIIALGLGVAPLLTTTSDLILIGNNAGSGLTTSFGSLSIAIGHNAMSGGGEFGNILVIGHNSADTMGGAEDCLVIGTGSADVLAGVDHTIVGHGSGRLIVATSSGVTTLGRSTGNTVTTASNITLLGVNTDVPIAEGAVSGYLNIHGLIYGSTPADRVQIGGNRPADATFGDASLRLNQTDAAFMTNILTTTERDAISVIENGMYLFNSTTGTHQFRQSAAWVELGGGGGVADLQGAYDGGPTIAMLAATGNLAINATDAVAFQLQKGAVDVFAMSTTGALTALASADQNISFSAGISTAGTGGTATFAGGSGESGTEVGGAVLVQGGDKVGGTGNAGDATFRGGDSTNGVGGLAIFRGGNASNTGNGGGASLLGGDASTGNGTNLGGPVNVIAGAGGSPANNDLPGAGALLNAVSGAGGSRATTGNGGVSGPVILASGAAGASAGTSNGVSSGDVTIQTGTPGAGAGTGQDGTSGVLTITTLAGGTNGANSGNMLIGPSTGGSSTNDSGGNGGALTGLSGAGGTTSGGGLNGGTSGAFIAGSADAGATTSTVGGASGGNAGSADFVSGAGGSGSGATSGNGGAAGPLNFTGGAGGDGAAIGGTDGVGADVTISAGASGTGGATGADGGSMHLHAGTGSANAGSMFIHGGDQLVGSGGAGIFKGGDSADGNGGSVSLDGGAAGTNGTGGAATVIGGAGAGTGGGGATTIAGGSSGTGATGNGASVGVGGGRALSTDGDGGGALLQGARGAGTGTDGSVLINLETGGTVPGTIQLQSDGTTFLTFDPNASVNLDFGADAGAVAIRYPVVPTVLNTAGGSISITAQQGNGTGAGGNNFVVAGDSGTGATGNAGAAALAGGTSQSTNGDGGSALVQGGSGSGTGTSGSVFLNLDSSSATDGSIQFQESDVTFLNFPTTLSTGTNGQVLTTDGSGNLSFTTPAGGVTDLQTAYDGGNTIAATAASGAVTINATNAVAGLIVQDGGSTVFEVSSTGSVAFDPTSGTNFVVRSTGLGSTRFETNGTGQFEVGSGGTDHLVMNAAGGTTFTPSANQQFTVTTIGGGDIELEGQTTGMINLTTDSANISLSSTTGSVRLSAGGLRLSAASSVDITPATDSAFTATTAGTGDIVLNAGGTGGLFLQEGGADKLAITAAGAIALTPRNNLDFTATTTGTGAITFDASGTGDVDINAAAGGVHMQLGGTDRIGFDSAGVVTMTSAAGQNFTAGANGAGNARLLSSAGAVNIDAVAGTVNIDATSVGNVNLQAASVTKLQVTQAGSVDITPTSAQDFTVTTTGTGDIILTTATGNVGINGAPSTGADLDIFSDGAGTGPASNYAIELVNANVTANAVISQGFNIDGAIRSFIQGVNRGNVGGAQGALHLGVSVNGTLERNITLDEGAIANTPSTGLDFTVATAGVANSIINGWSFPTQVAAFTMPTVQGSAGDVLTDALGDGVLSFQAAGGGATLQTAYDAGNTIALTAARTISISNTTDAGHLLTLSSDFVGSPRALHVTMGSATTGGRGLSVDLAAGSGANGIHVEANATATGSPFRIVQAGDNRIFINADGAISIDSESNQDASFTSSGTGNVLLTTLGSGNIAINSTSGTLALQDGGVDRIGFSAAGLISLTSANNQNINLNTAGTGSVVLTSAGSGAIDLITTGTGPITLTSADDIFSQAANTYTINSTAGQIDISSATATNIFPSGGTVNIGGSAATLVDIRPTGVGANVVVRAQGSGGNVTVRASGDVHLGGTAQGTPTGGEVTVKGVVFPDTAPNEGDVAIRTTGTAANELIYAPAVSNYQTTGVLFDGTNPTRFDGTAGAGVFETVTGATLTIPSAAPTGTYEVSMSYEWGYGSATSNFLGQLTFNGTAIVEHEEEPPDSAGTGGVVDSSDQVQTQMRVRTITHTTGVASALVLQIARADGGEDIAVRRVEITSRRVA